MSGELGDQMEVTRVAAWQSQSDGIHTRGTVVSPMYLAWNLSWLLLQCKGSWWNLGLQGGAWRQPFMGQSAHGARGDLFIHSFIHLAVSHLVHTYSEPGIAQSPED